MKLALLARGGALLSIGWTLSGVAAAQDPKPGFPQPEHKESHPPKIDPAAKMLEPMPTDEFRKQFRPGLHIPQTFSLQDQLDTYKKGYVGRDRPLMRGWSDSNYDDVTRWDWWLQDRPLGNFGRQMYKEGPLRDYPNLFGKLNPMTPHLLVYGDSRTAAGYSKNQDKEISRIATRLNIDVDLQLTATERIHAFFRPFDSRSGRIMNAEFGGADANSGGAGQFAGDEFVLDGEPDTLFFEGDLGPLAQGITGVRNNADMPFAVGKIPLFFQNGVWLEDAFVGAAYTIPAINSPKFDVSNMDITFFAGFDDVTSGAIRNADNGTATEGGNKLVGAATFIETREGYAELGLGMTVNERSGEDLQAANFTAAWTKRYWNFLSNSLRVIFNVGDGTEDGALFLCENSFRTPQPYTLLPYFNAFVGLGSPESLARDNGAGGVLKNTGINFEADALTLFPKLDDTGHDRIGAALGIEYLPNLFTAPHRQQIVFEVATVHNTDQDDSVAEAGDEIGLGARYQIALTSSWIFRCDAMVASVEDGDDRSGVRFELRKKW